MAKLIASELRGSEESGDKEAMNMSKPQVWQTKRQKNQLQPAALETWNSFNSLSAEKASDANGNHYQDELPALMWKARRGVLLHSLWMHWALPRKLMRRMQMMMMIFKLSSLHCWQLELCNQRAWKPRHDIVALYRCISDYFFWNW